MHWRSKLIHPGAHAPANFRSLAMPTYRGSTVVFERQADVSDDWRQTENGYSYGLYGTPTVVYPNLDRPGQNYGGRLVRLNVGLEESSDLIADLDQALNTMDRPA